MTKDMTLLDFMSCLAIMLTMPIYTLLFLVFGSSLHKMLKASYKDQFKEQQRSIRLATTLMGMSTFAVTIRFALEAFARKQLTQSINNLVNLGKEGFVYYFFFSNLLSDMLCYFLIICTVRGRRNSDWDIIFTLSLDPKPEQDILKPLAEELEANRLKDELLDSRLMVSTKKFDDNFSFDYSRASQELTQS